MSSGLSSLLPLLRSNTAESLAAWESSGLAGDCLCMSFALPIILYICGNSEIKLSEHKSIGSIYGDAFCKILSRTHLKGKKKTKLTRADKPANLVAWQYTKEIAYQMFLLGTLDLIESNEPENMHAIGLKNAKARTKNVLQEKYGIEKKDFVCYDDVICSYILLLLC